jgi:hypothetical protein
MGKKIKGPKAIETLEKNVVIHIPRMGANGKQNNLIICINQKGEYEPWKYERESGNSIKEIQWGFMMRVNAAGLRSATTTEVEFAEKAEVIRERFLKLSYNNRINWDGFRPVPKKTETKKVVKPIRQKVAEKPINEERLASLKERMKRDELIAK